MHQLKLTGTFSTYPHHYSWDETLKSEHKDYVLVLYEEDNKDAPFYVEAVMDRGLQTFSGEGWSLEAAEAKLEKDYEDHLEYEYGDKMPEEKIWPSDDDDFLDLTKGKHMPDGFFNGWKYHFEESIENFNLLIHSPNRQLWGIVEWSPNYVSHLRTPELIASCKEKCVQAFVDINGKDLKEKVLIQEGTIQDTRVYFKKNDVIYGIYLDYDNEKIVVSPFDCPVTKMSSFLGLKRYKKKEIVNNWLTEQKEKLGRKFTKAEFERVLAFLEE